MKAAFTCVDMKCCTNTRKTPGWAQENALLLLIAPELIVGNVLPFLHTGNIRGISCVNQELSSRKFGTVTEEAKARVSELAKGYAWTLHVESPLPLLDFEVRGPPAVLGEACGRVSLQFSITTPTNNMANAVKIGGNLEWELRRDTIRVVSGWGWRSSTRAHFRNGIVRLVFAEDLLLDTVTITPFWLDTLSCRCNIM
jgi:hypothetical protein